jgi:hypothetical protein
MFQYDSPCHIKGCSAVARGEDSFCNICRRDFCRSHFDRRRHWCRYQGRVSASSSDPSGADDSARVVPRGRFRHDKSDNQASETIADVDVEKLNKEVMALEPGVNFTLEKHLGDVSDRRDDGGPNIHIPIKFEGGKEWLLRIPSYGYKPEPADMVALVRTSEVLTYKALRAGGVLVPEVYSWGFGTVSKSAGEQSCCRRLNTRSMLLAHHI